MKQDDSVSRQWSDGSTSMLHGDSRKDCCKVEENLAPVERLREDLVFRRCSVCQCRHFELSVDPGVLFAQGAKVG